MVADDPIAKQVVVETPNQILRLLDALPSKIAKDKEVKLRETFRSKWFQTWRNPLYDPARIRAVDMVELKKILEVPDEFFLGTEDQINDCIRRAIRKYQLDVA